MERYTPLTAIRNIREKGLTAALKIDSDELCENGLHDGPVDALKFKSGTVAIGALILAASPLIYAAGVAYYFSLKLGKAMLKPQYDQIYGRTLTRKEYNGIWDNSPLNLD